MKAILVDLDRCIGCLACEIACKDENDLDAGVRRVNLRTVDAGDYNRFYVPSFDLNTRGMKGCTLCPQLQADGRTPACIGNCLTNALHFGDAEDMKVKADAMKMETVASHQKRGEVIYVSRKTLGDWLLEH